MAKWTGEARPDGANWGKLRAAVEQIEEPRQDRGTVAPAPRGGGRGRTRAASPARQPAPQAGEAVPGVVAPTYTEDAVRAHHERLAREVASGELAMTLLITSPVQKLQAGVPYDMDRRNLMVGFEALGRGHVGMPTQCQGFHLLVEPYPGNAWKFGAFKGRAGGELISAWTVSVGGDPLMERAAAVGWRHYRGHAPRPADIPEDVGAPWLICARGGREFGEQMAEAVLATAWAAVAVGRFGE